MASPWIVYTWVKPEPRPSGSGPNGDMMVAMETKLERRIDSIRLQYLLSFRDTTLELRNLNVVIGPNGSGKSNLLTALEILRGTRGDFRTAVRTAGGIELKYRGEESIQACAINIVGAFDGSASLRYGLKFEPGSSSILRESVECGSGEPHDSYLMIRDQGRAYATSTFPDEDTFSSEEDLRESRPEPVKDEVSALQDSKYFRRHSRVEVLGDGIESIRIDRPAPVGPSTPARLPQSVLEDETQVSEDSANLALVLNNLFSSGLHDTIDNYLSRFLPSYKRLTFRIEGGAVRMFLAEHGLKEPIPASRFSDGTIAFLRLIAVLQEPAIPMILAIEEPEAGLHPDAVRLVAEMIRDASEKKQILITTHSPELVDALSDDPEAVIVCEKDPEDGTQFRRLSAKDLDEWLERYTLGELWKKGEIGGTRW